MRRGGGVQCLGHGVSLRCGDGSYADRAGVCWRPTRTALTRSVRCKQPRVRGGRGTLHGVRHRGGDVPERQRVPGERGAWRDVPRLRRDGRVRGLQRGVLPLRLGVPCVHGRACDVLGRRVVRDVQRRALHDGDGGVQGEERDGWVFRGDRQRGRVRCVRRRALSAGQGVPPVRRRVRRVCLVRRGAVSVVCRRVCPEGRRVRCRLGHRALHGGVRLPCTACTFWHRPTPDGAGAMHALSGWSSSSPSSSTSFSSLVLSSLSLSPSTW